MIELKSVITSLKIGYVIIVLRVSIDLLCIVNLGFVSILKIPENWDKWRTKNIYFIESQEYQFISICAMFVISKPCNAFILYQNRQYNFELQIIALGNNIIIKTLKGFVCWLLQVLLRSRDCWPLQVLLRCRTIKVTGSNLLVQKDGCPCRV